MEGQPIRSGRPTRVGQPTTSSSSSPGNGARCRLAYGRRCVAGASLLLVLGRSSRALHGGALTARRRLVPVYILEYFRRGVAHVCDGVRSEFYCVGGADGGAALSMLLHQRSLLTS